MILNPFFVAFDTEEQSEQLVIQSNTCNVTQLLPYTTYHFYVRAYNSNGSSEASKIVDATTLQSGQTTPTVNQMIDWLCC